MVVPPHAPSPPTPAPNCRECHGTGWVDVHAYARGRADVLETARPGERFACPACARREARRERDRERAARIREIRARHESGLPRHETRPVAPYPVRPDGRPEVSVRRLEDARRVVAQLRARPARGVVSHLYWTSGDRAFKLFRDERGLYLVESSPSGASERRVDADEAASLFFAGRGQWNAAVSR